MTAIRAGICILLVFAVLAHGVIEPWSEAVLETGTAILLLIWVASALRNPDVPIVWNPLLFPLLAFCAVGAGQYATGMTAIPYLTRVELVRWTTLVALFFLTVQSFRTRNQWRAFLWFLLVFGFCVSLFGILQHFTWNGKIFWLREVPLRSAPFGPYENRNHFAGFVELLIPSGVAILILRGERRDQLPLLAFFSVLPIGALFLSASRAGIIGFLAGMAMLCVLVILRRRETKSLTAAAIIMALAIAIVSWLGIGSALERFAEYKGLEVSEARRVVIVRGTFRLFLDHPLLGTGLGTFQEVYPKYDTFYDGLIVNHSHNDYAEALAETGIVGGMCLLAFFVLLFWRAWKLIRDDQNERNLAYHIGAIVACSSLMIHALADFSFHIPANAFLFLVQAALATTFLPLPSAKRY